MAEKLTERQIELVKQSFMLVKPIQAQAAGLFYGQLFTVDPSLRPLFKGDMTEQGKKLMAMIATAVSSLHTLDRIIPAVESLGRRHSGYGVSEQHFDTVGQTLIWTLNHALGPAFTKETQEAWEATYGLLADVMKKAMQSKEEAAPVSTPRPAVQQPLPVPQQTAVEPAASLGFWNWLRQLLSIRA